MIMIKVLQVWLLAVYLLLYFMELIVRHFHDGQTSDNSDSFKFIFVLLFRAGFLIKIIPYSSSDLFSGNRGLSCFLLYGSAWVLGEH